MGIKNEPGTEGETDSSNIELNRIEERAPVEGIKAEFIHTEKMTIGFFSMAAGSTLSEHAHPHKQVSTMKEDELALTVGDET